MTVNVAVALPAASVTDAGAVSAVALLDRVTVAPLAVDTATAQVELAKGPRFAGVHVSERSAAAGDSVMAAVSELPLSEAVMIAVCELETNAVVAANVAVALPVPTVTEAGAANAAVLLDSVTVPPLVAVSVTVHVALAPELRLVGVQVNPLKVTGATSEIAAACELPLSEAVMVAVRELDTVPAVAVNVAVALPAGTVTEAGAVNSAELLDSVTVAPAAVVSVTVHVALAPELRLVGVHVNPLMVTGTTSEIAAFCELPLSEAVMVAVCELDTVPAVAVNVAVALPAGAVTEDGAVNAAELLDSVTVAPAVVVTVTVHVAVAAAARLVGLQVSPVIVIGATSEIAAVWVLPLSEAVMVAVCELDTVPAVTVNAAVALPAGAVTEAGAVNSAVLLDSVTVAPATVVSATVHVALAPELRLVGVQVNPLKVTGATSDIAAVWVLPLSEAVIIAVCELDTVPAVAVNAAVALPADTVTEAGAVNAPELLDSVTVAPAVVATVTVHVAVAAAARLLGLQVSPVTVIGATSEIAAVWVLPLNEAVMVAVCELDTVPAVAVNAAVALPAATVTEAGAVNRALLLDSVTVAPAAVVTVTVHVALAPEPRLAGLQVKPLNAIGAASEIAAVWVLPLSEAVMVAVCELDTVPAVAVNVAVALPAATVTEAGTVSAAALPDRETTAPPASAAALSVTVHVDDAPALKDAGAQLKPLRTGGSCGAGVTTPARPLMASGAPPMVVPSALATLTEALVAVDAMVTLTTATTPFSITAVFKPARIQT